MDYKKKLWLGLWIGLLLIVTGLVAAIQPNLGTPENRSAQQFTGSLDKTFHLQTAIKDGRMIFIGTGELDGVVNPDLTVDVNDVVQIVLTNQDGGTHDVVVPVFNAYSGRVLRKGDETDVTFRVDEEGSFDYFCSIAGHRIAGMEGNFIVGPAPEPQRISAKTISRDPADLPEPINRNEPAHVRFDLTAMEVVGKLSENNTYTYYTFNGKVPGPFLRVLEFDTVEIHLANPDSNTMVHSVDFHAVTGPGGGASVMQVPPGEEKGFTFKALKPGLYVYHCATPMVSHHIANGMYGMILVEPEEGLPVVDREFYIMQQEIYTTDNKTKNGHLSFSEENLLKEHPSYFVLNGAVGSLTDRFPLQANTGETIRIYFGVGGPDFTSSFHIIGEIMDSVYDQASLSSPPMQDVQTTLVPPGGATVARIQFEVPGTYKIVDHALSRVEKGLIGLIKVQGNERPDIFRPLDSVQPLVSSR